MQKLDFGEALDVIHGQDPRFDRDAYHFLREALDHTIKQRKKAKEGTGHVNGPQLLEGIRQYALKQFGPMVVTVFSYWGVRSCEDFGEMVFNLIRVGIFGKTETDTVEDFKGGYPFHEAFVTPFLPPQPVSHPRLVDAPAGDFR
ncbi:MAG: hypothetical protein QOE70_6513 [Chthoniobacter sp.]|jgi:uncharacterized repeat protein (TIGR04138 family)|nr:hypothetical protein [Chthoniobacter sp.]